MKHFYWVFVGWAVFAGVSWADSPPQATVRGRLPQARTPTSTAEDGAALAQKKALREKLREVVDQTTQLAMDAGTYQADIIDTVPFDRDSFCDELQKQVAYTDKVGACELSIFLGEYFRRYPVDVLPPVYEAIRPLHPKSKCLQETLDKEIANLPHRDESEQAWKRLKGTRTAPKPDSPQRKAARKAEAELQRKVSDLESTLRRLQNEKQLAQQSRGWFNWSDPVAPLERKIERAMWQLRAAQQELDVASQKRVALEKGAPFANEIQVTQRPSVSDE